MFELRPSNITIVRGSNRGSRNNRSPELTTKSELVQSILNFDFCDTDFGSGPST